MISLATIYKFKTPFFNLEFEKQNLEQIYIKSKDFLRFQDLEWKELKKETMYYKNILLIVDDILEITLSVTKDVNNIYLPLILIEISINNDTIKNWAIEELLKSFFEIFDGIKENSFILDINHSLVSSEKLPHDFLELNQLYIKYQKDKSIMKLIENFLTSKNKSQVEFIKIQEIFLYFTFLVFEIFRNLWKIEQTKTENKVMFQNNIWWLNIELSNQRLEHLENLNIANFEKYVLLLESFYFIFKK